MGINQTETTLRLTRFAEQSKLLCCRLFILITNVCTPRLPEIISKHTRRKPIMIFCCTRNSAITTSKELANLWAETNPPRRVWDGPSRRIEVKNPDLRSMIVTPAVL
jgi:hypothetical protein